MRDKFVKAGNWLWYSKELIVLLVMFGILGYRVYCVVYPPPPPKWAALPMPLTELPSDPAAMQGIEIPGDPPLRPPMDVPGSYAMLYNHNPFWYYSGQKRDEKKDVAPTELNIKLLELPEVVAEVEKELRPHTLCTYLYELATAFSTFYDNCPVLTAETADIRTSRLFLCRVTQETLARGLELLGIQAPREM